MNVLVQLDEKTGDDSLTIPSIHTLRMFCLHSSEFNKQNKTFIHYLFAIGYSGGGAQADIFYKIEGLDLEKSTIWISSNSGNDYFESYSKNQKTTTADVELSTSDLIVQRRFIKEMNKYLIYDDDLDFFYYDYESGYLRDSIFRNTDNFPLRILKFLQKVDWPFLTTW